MSFQVQKDEVVNSLTAIQSLNIPRGNTLPQYARVGSLFALYNSITNLYDFYYNNGEWILASSGSGAQTLFEILTNNNNAQGLGMENVGFLNLGNGSGLGSTATFTVDSVAGTVSIQMSDATLTFPNSTGAIGQYLQTNGNGVTSWATIPGSGATANLNQVLTSGNNANDVGMENVAFLNLGNGISGSNATLSINTSSGNVSIEMSGGGSFIVGSAGIGATNTINTPYSTIVGGADNVINGINGLSGIFGASVSSISGDNSCVVGGEFNSVRGGYSIIAGGGDNTVIGNLSTIVGGEYNSTNGTLNSIIGGEYGTVNGISSGMFVSSISTINGNASFIVGGTANIVHGFSSSIFGASYSNVSGAFSCIVGGSGNIINSNYSFVAGEGAQALNNNCFVWNGISGTTIGTTSNGQFLINANNVQIQQGVIELVNSNHKVLLQAPSLSSSTTFTLPVNGGTNGQFLSTDGNGNTSWATGGGGGPSTLNQVLTNGNNAGGIGMQNVGFLNIVNGGSNATLAVDNSGDVYIEMSTTNGAFFVDATNNYLRGEGAVDLQLNKSNSSQTASGQYSSLLGGYNNTASRIYSTVVGGNNNTVNLLGSESCIVGGSFNTVTYADSGIIAGNNNTVNSLYSFIGAGTNNTISGQNSFIGAGTNNIISGQNSFIGAGTNNIISGQNSFASGGGAQALNNNCFVWNGVSGTTIGTSSAEQFIIGATKVKLINLLSAVHLSVNQPITPGISGTTGTNPVFYNPGFGDILRSTDVAGTALFTFPSGTKTAQITITYTVQYDKLPSVVITPIDVETSIETSLTQPIMFFIGATSVASFVVTAYSLSNQANSLNTGFNYIVIECS